MSLPCGEISPARDEAVSNPPKALYPISFIERELDTVVTLPNFTPARPIEWPGTLVEVERSPLSQEETDYLTYISYGTTPPKIKHELNITTPRGNEIRNSLKAKLDVSDLQLPAAVKVGFERGILTAESRELAPDDELTEDEYRVLELIAQGKVTREIAIELSCSDSRTSDIRINMMNKLNANTPTHVVRRAYEFGIFKPQSMKPIVPISPNLLVVRRAETSPLNPKETFIIDAISRGVKQTEIAKQAKIALESIPYACQSIIHKVGAASLTGLVGRSIRRGFIPVIWSVNQIPKLNQNETIIVQGIERGDSGAAIMRYLGVTTITYQELRNSAFKKINAPSNPVAARRVLELQLAA